MKHRVAWCEACGAPLEAEWAELVIVCAACGSHNRPGEPGAPLPPVLPDDGRRRLNLGGRTWALEGRLGLGDSSVVYRGRWVHRLGEAVVIKVLAAMTDGDLLRREWEVLRALQASRAEGAAHFLSRLPSPVASGLVSSDRPRLSTVYGWKSGFVHTLARVGEVHPRGVPEPVMVWLLKRLLELLGFIHRAGVVHGAVTPEHILVHPRDHGALLIGWTCAQPWEGRGLPFVARPRRWIELYGDAREASTALDIQMAVRCVEAAAGWLAPGVRRPEPLQRVLERGLSGREQDAWALAEALTAASAEVHGPPSWNPLTMPGWA